MFTRVLVANRGEIAVRVIRALHELGHRGGRRLLDRRRRRRCTSGSPTRRSASGRPRRPRATCRIPSIVAAAVTTGCEAVHPGYGFLSENPAFVEACTDNDLVFVGPPASVMRHDGRQDRGPRGDARRRRADRRRAPRARRTLAEARSAAAEIGYPVMLKAAAGGGGRGMRLVDDPARARRCVRRRRRRGEGGVRRRHALRREGAAARRATSRSRCSATPTATSLTLGERECSIQRRHQKLVEETPSPALSPRAARGDGVRGRTRLPVGRLRQRRHVRVPARARRHVLVHRAERAAPGRASGDRALHRHRPRPHASSRSPRANRSRSTGRAPRRGHSIEIRLNAEDPARDFMPAPGHRDPLPAAARARASASTPSSRTATTISPYYDSLIAKLIVWDVDRPAAIARAERGTRGARRSRASRRPASSRSRSSQATSSEAASTRPRRSPSWRRWPA